MLSRAIEEAHRSNMEIKHGAIITYGGKIISAGHNHKRNRIAKHECCSVHAEMHAIWKYHREKRSINARSIAGGLPGGKSNQCPSQQTEWL